MHFAMTSPCSHCPFRSDIQPFLTKERAVEIAKALDRGTFSCHKTNDYSEDHPGGVAETEDSQHCAGALIMLEKEQAPSQAMRIAERLGLYDHTQLDMTAAVYGGREEFMKAHKERVKAHGDEASAESN